MLGNASFFLPLMAAVVTAVVTGYQYYRSQQQQLENAEHDGERKRRRIRELESRLADLDEPRDDRKIRRTTSRKRKFRAAAGQDRQDAPSDAKNPHERIEELERRLFDMETERTCLICYDRLRSVLFDCAHLVTCELCASKLEVCPMCRNLIRTKKSVPLFN